MSDTFPIAAIRAEAADSGMTNKPAELSQRAVVPGSRYSSSEVDRGLVALALCDGSSRRAEKLLADQGERISESTLRRWREDQYADRYLELRAKALPRLNALAADRHAELATRASELNLRMLDRLDDVYEQIEPRDLPGAARNVATVAGIHEDKRALRDGQAIGPHSPTRSVADILHSLQATAPGLFDEKGTLKLTRTESVEVGAGHTDDEPAIEGIARKTNPHPPSPQQSP